MTRPHAATRLDARELLRAARRLSEDFHRAKVPKEERAWWVALLCLAMREAPELSAEGGGLLEHLDQRGAALFEAAQQGDLWLNARVEAVGEHARRCEGALGNALLTLRKAGVDEAADGGDVLGTLFEAFLRYGNSSKELGVVLTPGHLCRFAAAALAISEDDIVYDPAAGTGGFLVEAINAVDPGHARAFASKRVFAAEVSPQLGALAAINLHLRAGAKGRIHADSCFASRLSAESRRAKYPRFVPAAAGGRPERRVTRVLMNPPFSLRDSREVETAFVDHALAQMVEGGLLFAVVPSSILYDDRHAPWRSSLLQDHALRAVVLLPTDLFYPVATETLAFVLEAGRPHGDRDVLWARVSDDGYVKRKGFRVPAQGGGANDLTRLEPALRSWLTAGRRTGVRPGFVEYSPIRGGEWLPQVHLGTPKLDRSALEADARAAYRAMVRQRWEAQERGS